MLLFHVATTEAQSVVAPRNLDITFGKAFWGTLLPGYELGSDATGDFGVQDDLDSPGVIWEWKGVKRFLDTRTSVEFRGFYGTSWSNQLGNDASVNLPNPISGANIARSGGRSHLSSDLDHYGFDFTMRDTWRTRFGGLSAGMTFSYMAFDQDFDIKYNRVALFSETLDSDFLGGKAVVGWEGSVLGRATTLDLMFGYYDLDVTYEFVGGTVGGSLVEELADHSATIEAKWTTWVPINQWYVGFSLGAMYISDMPKIVHNSGAPVSLITESAGTVSAGIEVLF